MTISSTAPTTRPTASLPEGRFLLHRRMHALALSIEGGFADLSTKLDVIIARQPAPGSDRVAIFFALSVNDGRIFDGDPFLWGKALMGRYRTVAAIARLQGGIEEAARRLLDSVTWLSVGGQLSKPTEDEAEQIVRVARRLSTGPGIEAEHEDDIEPADAAPARRRRGKSSAARKS